MSDPVPVTRMWPSFVRAMSEAAEAAIRQGIPAGEAVARAAFAIDAEYAAASLPTSLPTDTTTNGATDDPQQ